MVASTPAGEGTGFALLLLLRVARAMVLWVALYLAVKVQQDAYTQAVLVDGRPDAAPPLARVIWIALALDLCASAAVALALMLVARMHDAERTGYVLDGRLLALAAVDYALGTLAVLALGLLVARVAQDRRTLRYGEDGLRGARAYGTVMLYAAFVVLSVPFHRVLG